MKSLNRILFVIVVLGISIGFAQSDTNTDNHRVSFIIPQIALLDIEPEGSKDISMTFTAPAEAGDPFADETDNSLWLNVTSIVASGGTRDISVKLDAAIAGLDS